MEKLSKKIIETLDKISNQYKKISLELESPEIANDFNRFRVVNQNLKKIESTFLLYKEYKSIEKSNLELSDLLKDADMKEIAKEEISANDKRTEELVNLIKISLIPKSELDDKDIIMEIRGAVGGEEANIFAKDLYEMYKKYFEKNKWNYTIVDFNESESGGFTNISFEVKGKDVYSFMKYESGGHRVQRVPRTESMGRIHTSVATVAVLPKPDSIESVVNNSDLRIDTYRASGAGGQHVNKTDSAIRITHIPTGIVVQSQDGRSQHDNKSRAMEILAAKLYEVKQKNLEDQQSSIRKDAVGTGERSEKIRTYNYPQNRVTDHRIMLSLNKLDQFMEGNIEEIINSLIANEQEQKLKESGIF